MPRLGSIFSRIAAKILDVDQTALPEQQFAMIQDMLANAYTEIKGEEVKQLLDCLKRKHLVNGITVRKLKRGLVFSSGGNGIEESESASRLIDFANRELAATDFVIMRTEKDWMMLMPLGGSLYTVRANSALSGTEMHALASEIEAILRKKRLS